MAKTKTELGKLALQMLQAVEGDAPPDTNDTTIIEDAYDQVYQRLRARHLVSWGSTGSIPDEVVTPVAALVAESRIAFFKPPEVAERDIRTKAQAAFGDISEVITQDYYNRPIEAEYY